MAYTFTVLQSYSVNTHEILLNNFIHLKVKRLSDGVIVYQTALSGKPALRVVNSNYEIGIFNTQDPIFERKINIGANPHTMDVTKVGADYCFIGTTNDGTDTVTFQYKLNLCLVEIWKTGGYIYLRSPVCPGQSGCGNCFSETRA